MENKPLKFTTAPFSMGFMKIVVKDLPRALKFYQTVLSLETLSTIELPDLTEVILGFPGQEIGPYVVIFHRPAQDVTMGNAWGPLGISVSDVDAIYKKALENGGTSSREPFSFDQTRVAFFLDPEGHEIELIHQP